MCSVCLLHCAASGCNLPCLCEAPRGPQVPGLPADSAPQHGSGDDLSHPQPGAACQLQQQIMQQQRTQQQRWQAHPSQQQLQLSSLHSASPLKVLRAIHSTSVQDASAASTAVVAVCTEPLCITCTAPHDAADPCWAALCAGCVWRGHPARLEGGCGALPG